jgi:hypothetical protein
VLSPEEIADLGDGGEVSTEDVLVAQMAARASDKGITYVAFTATPKVKTVEIFGISGTIAYLDRTACNSVAPLCYAVTPALRRNRCTVTGAVTVSRFGNATALPSHVTLSHTRYTVTPRSENSAGPETEPGAIRPERGLAPGGHCVLQLQEHRFRERFGSRPIRQKI